MESDKKTFDIYTFSTLSGLCFFKVTIIIIDIIIIIVVLLLASFHTCSNSWFSLESKWQQVSSTLKNFSQYSSQS